MEEREEGKEGAECAGKRWPSPLLGPQHCTEQKVLRIRWGMSQDREINPRSPLAKDKKNLGKNKQTSALNYPTERTTKSSLGNHHNGKVLMVSARPTDGW